MTAVDVFGLEVLKALHPRNGRSASKVIDSRGLRTGEACPRCKRGPVVPWFKGTHSGSLCPRCGWKKRDLESLRYDFECGCGRKMGHISHLETLPRPNLICGWCAAKRESRGLNKNPNVLVRREVYCRGDCGTFLAWADFPETVPAALAEHRSRYFCQPCDRAGKNRPVQDLFQGGLVARLDRLFGHLAAIRTIVSPPPVTINNILSGGGSPSAGFVSGVQSSQAGSGLEKYGDGSTGALTLVADTVLAVADNIKYYSTLDVVTFVLSAANNGNDTYLLIHCRTSLNGSGGVIGDSTGAPSAIYPISTGGGGGASPSGGNGGNGGAGGRAVFVLAQTITGTLTVKAAGINGSGGTVAAGGGGSSNGVGSPQATTAGRWFGSNFGAAPGGGGGGLAAGTAGAASIAGAAQTANTREVRNLPKILGLSNMRGFDQLASLPVANMIEGFSTNGGGGGGGGSTANVAQGAGGGGGGCGGTQPFGGKAGDGGIGGAGSAAGPAALQGAGGGGGGGGGGYIAMVFCETAPAGLTVTASGGNGAAGASASQASSGTGGGGGGESGGTAVLRAQSGNTATVTAVAGTGGAVGGTGVAGAVGGNGTAGFTFNVPKN